MYSCNSWSLLRALWFGSCATHILWYTYLKAFWNTSLHVLGLKRKGHFKTTVKTGVNAAIAELTAGGGAPGERQLHAITHLFTGCSLWSLPAG